MSLWDEPVTEFEAREMIRYEAAAHAVQSGVKFNLEANGDTSNAHKHLRTGINMAFANNAGIAKLLIEKGLITRTEYYTAMADAAEDEKKAYETKLGVSLA